MSKIKSTKAFKNAVNEAFDTQTLRDKAKREYDALHRDFDERHDTLCDYADEHPEVFWRFGDTALGRGAAAKSRCLRPAAKPCVAIDFAVFYLFASAA